MAIITLTNKSQVTRKTVDVNDAENKVLIDRSIYQRLGSLAKNKTILDDYNNNKLPLEFRETLDKLDAYYSNIIHKENKVIDADIIELDKFLGNLGISIEYPYSEDSINIPSWVSAESKNQQRYLTDGDVILMDGNNILVRNL